MNISIRNKMLFFLFFFSVLFPLDVMAASQYTWQQWNVTTSQQTLYKWNYGYTVVASGYFSEWSQGSHCWLHKYNGNTQCGTAPSDFDTWDPETTPWWIEWDQDYSYFNGEIYVKTKRDSGSTVVYSTHNTVSGMVQSYLDTVSIKGNTLFGKVSSSSSSAYPSNGEKEGYWYVYLGTSPADPGAFTSPTTSTVSQNGQVTATWGATPNWGSGSNKQYILQFYNGSSWSNDIQVASNTITYPYTLPNGISTNQAKFRVKASTSVKDSNWVESPTFTTSQPPSLPGSMTVPTTGTKVAKGQNVTVTWGATTDWGTGTQHRYIVQFFDGTAWSSDFDAGNVTSISYFVLANTPTGNNAKFRVKAQTEHGDSLWVEGQVFSVVQPPLSPTPFTSPTALTKMRNDQSLQVEWGATTDWGSGTSNQTYILQFFNGSNWGSDINVGNTTTYTFSFPVGLDTKQAKFRVKASTIDGDSSWVESSSFWVEPLSIPLSSSYWKYVSGGDQFRTRVSDTFANEKYYPINTRWYLRTGWSISQPIIAPATTKIDSNGDGIINASDSTVTDHFIFHQGQGRLFRIPLTIDHWKTDEASAVLDGQKKGMASSPPWKTSMTSTDYAARSHPLYDEPSHKIVVGTGANGGNCTLDGQTFTNCKLVKVVNPNTMALEDGFQIAIPSNSLVSAPYRLGSGYFAIGESSSYKAAFHIFKIGTELYQRRIDISSVGNSVVTGSLTQIGSDPGKFVVPVNIKSSNQAGVVRAYQFQVSQVNGQDQRSLTLLWEFGPSQGLENGVPTTPVYDAARNRVYFTDKVGTLYALNADTGALLYKNMYFKDSGGSGSTLINNSPALYENTLLVPFKYHDTGDGNGINDSGIMVAYDLSRTDAEMNAASDATIKWVTTSAGIAAVKKKTNDAGVLNQAAYTGDTFHYEGQVTNDPTIIRLDKLTGGQYRSNDPASPNYMLPNPDGVMETYVLMGNSKGVIRLLTLETGRLTAINYDETNGNQPIYSHLAGQVQLAPGESMYQGKGLATELVAYRGHILYGVNNTTTPSSTGINGFLGVLSFPEPAGPNLQTEQIWLDPYPTTCQETHLSVMVRGLNLLNPPIQTDIKLRIKRPDGTLVQPEVIETIQVPEYDVNNEAASRFQFPSFTFSPPSENVTLTIEFEVNGSRTVQEVNFGDNKASRNFDFYCGSILPKFVNYEKTSFETSKPENFLSYTVAGKTQWLFSYNKNAQIARRKDNVFFDMTAGHNNTYFGNDLPTGVKKKTIETWDWKVKYNKNGTIQFINPSDQPLYLSKENDSTVTTVLSQGTLNLDDETTYVFRSPLEASGWWNTNGTDRWNEAVKPYQATYTYPTDYQCHIENIILSNNLFRFITVPSNVSDAVTNNRSHYDDGTFTGDLYPMSNFPDDSDSFYYGGFVFHHDFVNPCMKWVAIPTTPSDIATNQKDDYDDGTYEGKLYPLANFPDLSDSVYYAGLVWKKGFEDYDVKWVTVPTNGEDLATNNRSHYDDGTFMGELYPLSNFPDDSGAIYYGGLVFRKTTVENGRYDYKFVTRPTNPVDIAENGSDYYDDGEYAGQLYPLSNFPDQSDSVYYGGIVAYKNNYE